MIPIPAARRDDDPLSAAAPPTMTAFEQRLTQAMEDFANRPQSPRYDGDGILRRTRRRRTLLAVTASGAVALTCAGVTLALHPLGHSPAAATAAVADHRRPPASASAAATATATAAAHRVTVPSAIGQTENIAVRELNAAGLSVGTVRSARSDTVAPGLVIAESPGLGTLVPAGARVALTVSQGPAHH
jgi:hypothetical protein